MFSLSLSLSLSYSLTLCEKSYGKTTIAKKVTEKTTIGIKTVKTSQHRFPTSSLLMLFHAFVNSFFKEHYALIFVQITSTLVLSLEKQSSWALKCAFLFQFHVLNLLKKT